MVNSENADRVKVDPSRREFTAASISALFVGMGVTLTGCGGGSGGDYGTAPSSAAAPAAAATPTSSADKSGSISGNHGHVAVIAAATLQSGGAVTVEIQGTSDHSHGLELTADQVGQIASGTRITKTTPPAQTVGEYGSYGQHDHTVTFN